MRWGWVYSTVSSVESAQKIAKYLVEKKLIACANVIPNIISYYEDKGSVESHTESALILKTKESLFQKIQKEIESIHSYECPCLIFIPADQISHPFLKWMKQQVFTEIRLKGKKSVCGRYSDRIKYILLTDRLKSVGKLLL